MATEMPLDQDEFEARINRLVKKRDYAADVLGKSMLAWSYQDEIDRLVTAQQKAEND
jgi:hypothetical protein